MMVVIGFLLRIVSHLFLVSSKARSCRLFSGTPWLPLSDCPPREDGERILLTALDGQSLAASYFMHTSPEKRGVVLFCHELNGNRFGISPYIDAIRQAGFDLLSFDFRGHGESLSAGCSPTPRVTQDDLNDVEAAIDTIIERNGSAVRIAVLGMGKGATVALCAAGRDSRVTSVVLDGPSPEGRFFEKNCWDALVRSSRSLATSWSPRYLLLLGKAILYTLACPFSILRATWQRYILGFWCGCRFVNTTALIKNVRQPVFIVHGNVDSLVRADQIHAFRERMGERPQVWFVPGIDKRRRNNDVLEDCYRQVTRFLSLDHEYENETG